MTAVRPVREGSAMALPAHWPEAPTFRQRGPFTRDALAQLCTERLGHAVHFEAPAPATVAGDMRQITLRDGLVMHMLDAEFPAETRWESVMEPSFTVFIHLHGSGECAFSGTRAAWHTRKPADPAHALVLASTEATVNRTIIAAGRSRAITLTWRLPDLRAFLAKLDATALDEQVGNLLLGTPPSLRMVPLPATLRQSLDDLFLLPGVALDTALSAGTVGHEVLLTVTRWLTRACLPALAGPTAASRPALDGHDLAMIRAAMDTVLAAPAEAHTLASLARKVGTNVDKLKGLFPVVAGTSVGGFIDQVRMTLARERLEHGHEAVQTIAFACGYRNAAAFSRAFRARHGMSPRSYRNKRMSRLPACPER